MVKRRVEFIAWAARRQVPVEEIAFCLSSLSQLMSMNLGPKLLACRIGVEANIMPQPAQLDFLFNWVGSSMTMLHISEGFSAEVTNTVLLGFMMFTELQRPVLTGLELSDCTCDQWTVTHLLRAVNIFSATLQHLVLDQCVGCILLDPHLYRIANCCRSLVEFSVDTRMVTSISPILSLLEANPSISTLILNNERVLLGENCPITNDTLTMMLALLPKLVTLEVMSPHLTVEVVPKIFRICPL